MADRYWNRGAPIPRLDGSMVESGAVFEPTDYELRTCRHKIERVPEVEDFHVGGGWYDIPYAGKVQGKEAARAALAEALELTGE